MQEAFRHLYEGQNRFEIVMVKMKMTSEVFINCMLFKLLMNTRFELIGIKISQNKKSRLKLGNKKQLIRIWEYAVDISVLT